jgi:hypothetical protein
MSDIFQGIKSGFAPTQVPAQPTPQAPQFEQATSFQTQESQTPPIPPAAPQYSEPTQPPTSTETPQEQPFEPQDNQYFPEDMRPQPEQLLIEWEAPNRPFKKRNKQYYTTIAIIVFLISLILFFAGQFLPIAVVIAVGFLAYVLSAVPPEMITNHFTTYGVRTDNQIYYWDELGRFWFTQKHQQQLLHIEVARFPNQLTLLLADQDPEDIRFILSQVLLEEQPLPTGFDKAAAWLQEKIPLDTDS